MDNQPPISPPPQQNSPINNGKSKTPLPLPETTPNSDQTGVVVSNNFSPPIKQDITPAFNSVAQPDIELSNNSLELRHSNHKKLWLALGATGTILSVMFILLYFWLLPTMWANSFVKNVKQPYNQQVYQIASVYQSINNHVFMSVGSDRTAYQQELSSVKSLAETALSNTNSLQAADHLTILPAAILSSSATKANSEYQAMQTYVSGSQQFLNDYQATLTYLSQISQILNAQLPKLNNDINADCGCIGSAALEAHIQTTSNDLQKFTNEVQALKPSTDLKEFQGNLISNLQSLNSSLQALNSAFQGNPAVNIDNTLGELTTSYQNLSDILSSSPTANLRVDSSLRLQITKLKSEHPLQQ